MTGLRCPILVVLGCIVICAASAWARADDVSPCSQAIVEAEQAAGLPPALLNAIAVVESGRYDTATRRVVPWPWTINVEGVGSFYETRADAIAAVTAAQAAGRRSIDVGCMQINLMHHPAAFTSLENAFDPHGNAAYAAGFLLRLRAQFRDWGDAAAAYHSQTPGMADDYRRRVVAAWGGAARYGVTQYAAPALRAMAGFRPAPGLRHEAAGGYTPEFRARLAQDAADGRALRIAMGLIRPASRGHARPVLQASLR